MLCSKPNCHQQVMLKPNRTKKSERVISSEENTNYCFPLEPDPNNPECLCYYHLNFTDKTHNLTIKRDKEFNLMLKELGNERTNTL